MPGHSRVPTVVAMGKPSRWIAFAASVLILTSATQIAATAAGGEPVPPGTPYVVCEIVPIFWWCEK